MNLYIKNLTTNAISIEGAMGKNRTSIGAKASKTIADNLIIGDTQFCTALSTLITNSKILVSIGSASGTALTAANMLKYASGATFDNDSDGVLDRKDVGLQRVLVEGLDIVTLNDEVSTAIGGASTSMFVPDKLIVQITAVGEGDAATGNFQITVGTATGGTQLLTATACTGCNAINETFMISLTGVKPKIVASSTLYVKCTTKDTTGGAGHTANIYVCGEIIPAA